MQFRPCIDIHNGKVKQIVGSSLRDEGDRARENFVSGRDASYYAEIYRERGYKGGHVILLNHRDSEYYEATRQQAVGALKAYPGGLQVGGGITPETAGSFLDAGASHVIVTSYVFADGAINYDRLEKLRSTVGKEHLVLDLSCRRQGGSYLVVTDRWQKFTKEEVTIPLIEKLSAYCDEFLIHAVDVEGKVSGIETDLVETLKAYDGCPLTYAGGIGNLDTLRELKVLGEGRIHATIGSAMKMFGGTLELDEIDRVLREGD